MIPTVFLSHAAEILGETETGLSGNNIVKTFVPYAVDCDVDIPHSIYPFNAPNKRTALLQNLRRFEPEIQYKIIKDFCEHPNLPKPHSDNISNLKIQLIARYGDEYGSASSETLNLPLVEEVRHWLDKYEKSKNLYESALTKFNNSIFERNLLDDLRLSLERLLRNILENNKSLENQLPHVGQFVNKYGGSKHFSNMFRLLLDYYSKYNNTFVKHDDAVIEEEVEFIFEMTSSFMKHLVKLKNKS